MQQVIINDYTIACRRILHKRKRFTSNQNSLTTWLPTWRFSVSVLGQGTISWSSTLEDDMSISLFKINQIVLLHDALRQKSNTLSAFSIVIILTINRDFHFCVHWRGNRFAHVQVRTRELEPLSWLHRLIFYLILHVEILIAKKKKKKNYVNYRAPVIATMHIIVALKISWLPVINRQNAFRSILSLWCKWHNSSISLVSTYIFLHFILVSQND